MWGVLNIGTSVQYLNFNLFSDEISIMLSVAYLILKTISKREVKSEQEAIKFQILQCLFHNHQS